MTIPRHTPPTPDDPPTPANRPAETSMEDQQRPASPSERRSLRLAQRVFVSLVAGGLAAAAALFVGFYPLAVGRENVPFGSVVGLWVMSGVVGLVGAGAILIANRRSLLSPWLLLGLIPMAVTGYWVLS